MILFSQCISAALQLLLMTCIPLIWYVATQKRASGFFRWLGLTSAPKAPINAMILIFVIFTGVITLPYIWLYRSGSLNYQGFTVDSFRQSGWSMQTICVILIWAVVQTSLSEEIFFRGFLCKRLCSRLGERRGNAIHALLFGMIHIPAAAGGGIIPALLIAAFSGGIGYALGWLCLQKAKGSIVYGWCMHAAVNILSPVIVFTFLL